MNKSRLADVLQEERAERRFRLLAEAIPQIVWTTTADGYCDYQNRRWHEYSGMSAEESSGSGWLEAVHPEDRAQHGSLWAEIFEKGTKAFEFEYRLRRADGDFQWFLARAEPICDDEGKVVRWFGTSTDIDDRKRAEDDTRRKNEDRFRLAAEAAHLGYWDWDIVSDSIAWSEGLEAISETSPEAFGVTFESFLALVHPDDREFVAEAVRTAVARGTPYETKFRMARPDGSYRWALSKGQTFYDSEGRPVRMSGIDVDVTARKQAEEDLRRSEERFRASIDTLIDCFAIYTAIRDDRGQITDFRAEYVNLPACRNNLMTREQQVGRGLLELLPAHRESGLFDKYCRVVETGEPLDIEEIFYEDVFGGEPVGRMFSICVSKLDDGYVAAWRDISDRKKAEEALQESLAFSRRIAETSPAGLHIFDLGESRSVYLNHQVGDHLGCSRDAILAMGRDLVPTLMHPEDLLRFPEHLAKVSSLIDGEQLKFEFRMKDVAGRWHWFASHDSVFKRDTEGRATQVIGAAIDITEHRSAQDALHETEQRFLAFANSNIIGVIFADVLGGVSYANDEYLRIIGYSRAEFESGKGGWADVTPPEWLPVDQQAIEAARAGDGSAPPYEKEYIRKDGTRIPVVVGFTIYGAEETLAFILDISERKRAEEERRLTNNRFELAMRNSQIAVCNQDLDLRFTWIYNPAMGDAANEVLGKHDKDIFDRVEDAAVTEAIKRAVIQTGVSQRQEVQIRLQGIDRCYDLLVDPLRDSKGNITGVTCVGVDLTQRKQAEQELARVHDRLEESFALLDVLMAKAPIGIAFVDCEFRYVRINEVLASINGVPLQDHIGLRVQDIIPRLWPGVEPLYLRALAGETIVDQEISGETAAAPGELRHWRASYYPVSVKTEIIGLGIVVAEITPQKRFEQALKQDDRRKDEFLAMLAHELRNPVAAISNAHALVRAEKTLTGDPGWAIDVIDRQLRQLGRLIDDLLDVSRIRNGKIQLRLQRIDASMAISRAVESVRGFIEGRRHELVVLVSPDPMPLEADPTRLEQILSNLLTNAAKYTDEGGRILLDAKPVGDEVVIRVRDNGVGISAEMRRKVFDLFAQVDKALDRSQGGLGIGLALVRSLTEMHRGSVTVESDGPGLGTEFTVRLPLLVVPQEVEPESAVRLVQPAQGQRKVCRILVVDDNSDTLLGMAKLLGRIGHEVFTADDGPSALDAIQQHRPEVVLLDIGLPGMSGYEVAQAIRSEADEGVILIALSGYAQEKDRQRSRDAGFDHHLAKPVNLDELREIIEASGSNR
jgi:PAS domain S-box-containing protein